MDFGELLHTAHKNGASEKKEIRYYSTKFEPPKKEQRTKQLSVNVKKFLEKKEAEEKRKLAEAQKRKEELLALRAQDKKATRRVSVMLKRTKSANQSVIEDAVDSDNTAVTLAGPAQPDEDDYGYVSQEASAYYNKMMEKYSKIPEEKKFDFTKKKVSTNLGSTKDRVKAALEREREEALLPRKRKRKHKEPEGGATQDVPEPEKEEEREEEKPKAPPPKPKPKMPPPMNFADLLKIAEKKQFEPIMIEQKPKEEERLLTKRQRKEMEKEREWRERREARWASAEADRSSVPSSSKIPRTEVEKPQKANEESNRIPKVNPSAKPSSDRPTTSNKPVDTNSKRPEPAFDRSKVQNKGNDCFKKPESSPSLDRSKAPILNKALTSSNSSSRIPSKSQITTNRSEVNSNQIPKSKDSVTEYSKNRDYPSKTSNVRPLSANNSSSRDIALKDRPKKLNEDDIRQRKPVPQSSHPKKLPPAVNGPSKKFPPDGLRPNKSGSSDTQTKQFPPKDLKPKQFPPPDLRRKEPPRKKPLVPNKGRILDDDDSEYDSEMDDFIDDDPEEADDYSKYISEIFGYDKSKYRDVDDDVDNMESSFAQQMREEVISTKIGIMEDLEDIKKEEEYKKKKALMKKGRR